MIWLGIDTANTPLSVAIVKDGELLAGGELQRWLLTTHCVRCQQLKSCWKGRACTGGY